MFDEYYSDIIPKTLSPHEGRTRVERLASDVLQLLDEVIPLEDVIIDRTRDVIQIDVGGERGIVVVVTPDSIEFRLPTIEWTMGAYSPAESSKFWKRIAIDSGLGAEHNDLATTIAEALEAREQEFVPCRYCKKDFPPKRRVGDVCHGCASEHLGMVF